MSDRKNFEIDYQALDVMASQLGVESLGLLGLDSRAKSTLTDYGLGSLSSLERVLREAPYDFVDLDQVGMDTAKKVFHGIRGLSGRPMSDLLEALRELAKPKIIPKKPRREPLLPKLAPAFYENGGRDVDNDVTIKNLRGWSSISYEREALLRHRQISGMESSFVVVSSNFSGPDLNEIANRNLIPGSLLDYMKQRKRWEVNAIEDSFDIARGAGFNNVEAIREATDARLNALGARRGFFLRVGFGRIIEGRVVPANQYMLPPGTSV